MSTEDENLERELLNAGDSKTKPVEPRLADLRLSPSIAPPPLAEPVPDHEVPAATSFDTSGFGTAAVRKRIERPPDPPPAAHPDEPFSGKTVEFERENATKLGILGGHRAGKSYLLRAMVQKLANPKRSGALAYYSPKLKLWESSKIGKAMVKGEMNDFLGAYRKWEPVKQTTIDETRWFRLDLECRAGIFAKAIRLEVDVVDGPGESLQGTLDKDVRGIFDSAFSKASIMMFCLPIWAAFPIKLDKENETQRDRYLRGFSGILRNYEAIRDENTKVKCILVLTMADDYRSALITLKSRWIDPYVDVKKHKDILKQLTNPWRLTRYLQNAQAISDYLHSEFEESKEGQIHSIPSQLEFGRGRPWILPVTAVDGAKLAIRDKANGEPIPAHVELPLLVAMCEKHNALM